MSTFGPAYSGPIDGDRLSKQFDRILALVRDGRWRTLREIGETTKDPPASVSAQLRHMRKQRFGGYLVEKRHRGEPSNGLWEYRLVLERTNDRESNARHPVQFLTEDMRLCLEILRNIYPSLTPEQREPIGKLGQWLASHVQEEIPS